MENQKRCMDVLGFKADGRIGFRVYAYGAAEWAILVNLIFFLVDRWDKIDERIDTMKAMALLLAFISYSWTLVRSWDEFYPMMMVLKGMAYQIPFGEWPERKWAVRDLERDVFMYNKTWRVMVFAYVVSTTAIPIMIVCIKTFLFSGEFHKVIRETTSLPFPLYYPKSISPSDRLSSIAYFAAAYVVHSLYIMATAFYARLVYAGSLCAIANIQHELKLLRLSVEEADRNPHTLTESLPNLIRYIVRHHQEIYRKFDIVNNGVKWIAVTICFVASLYICTSVFTIVQKDHLILQLQEAVFFAVWACGIFLFDYGGENVRNENENLKDSLYDSGWIDKPTWYKKSLLTVMTRASRPVDIRPFGLYGFHLNGFAKTMNATYCYYNLLCKFKSN